MRATAALILVAVTGCATVPEGPSIRSLWAQVGPGQPKEEVILLMGPPDEFSKENGQEILVWKIDRFEKCATLMDKAGKVEGKLCKDNAEARAQAQASRDAMMLQMMRNRQQQAPAFQPVRPYQHRQPTHTNCTTMGNQINCTSQPTGPDMSIYNMGN